MAYPGVTLPRSTLPPMDAINRALVVGRRDVLKAAPPMPTGFHGTVTYRFRDGRLVCAEVEETILPDEVKR